MDELVWTLRLLANLAPLVPLAFAWRDRPLLWWYALASLVADISVLLLGLAGFGGDWVGNLFLAVELMLISRCYAEVLRPSFVIRLIATIGLAAFITHTILKGADSLNLPGAAVMSILYLVYALLGFAHLIRNTPTFFPERTGLFWMNCMLLLYASSTCMMFLFYDDVLTATPQRRLAWGAFFLTMNLCKYALLSAAVAVGRQRVLQWKPA